MIKVGIVGNIGSGKSYVAKQFLCPVFDADTEVNKIYLKDKNCYKKIKKTLPKFIKSFPIKKNEIGKAILNNKKNLKKIIKIVHPLIRKEMNSFIKKNKKEKMVVLDIPLLLENNLAKKNYILVFVEAEEKDILKQIVKRKNYNSEIYKKLKSIQLPVEFKRKKSNFIIKNNFKSFYVKKSVKFIKNKILNK